MSENKFIPLPQLSTERLTLRRLEPQDDQAVLFLRSDEKVNQFLDRPRAASLDDARAFMAKIIQREGEGYWWAITVKPGNELIGSICLFNISSELQEAEIGYELHPDFQGKGIMQEALSAVLRFGFEQLKCRAITAVLAADNLASRRLLEKNHFQLIEGFEEAGMENLLGYILEAV